MKNRNPVAKNMRSFNKASVQVDRKRQSKLSSKDKHGAIDTSEFAVMKDEKNLMERPVTKEVLNGIFSSMGISDVNPVDEINNIVARLKNEDI